MSTCSEQVDELRTIAEAVTEGVEHLGLSATDMAHVAKTCRGTMNTESEATAMRYGGALASILECGNPAAVEAAAKIKKLLGSFEPESKAVAQVQTVNIINESQTARTVYGVAVEVAIDKLKTSEPFISMFRTDPVNLEKIVESMRTRGFDRAHPIIAWLEANLTIDGMTRLLAAQRVGLKRVWVVYHSFSSEDAAFEYAVRNQCGRRNLKDSDILRLVGLLDRRWEKRSADRRSPAGKATPSIDGVASSAAETAKLIGTSPTKVEKARRIFSKLDPSVRDAVLAGTTSLNEAVTKARAEKAKTDKLDTGKLVAKAAALLESAANLLHPHFPDLADQITAQREVVLERGKPEQPVVKKLGASRKPRTGKGEGRQAKRNTTVSSDVETSGH